MSAYTPHHKNPMGMNWCAECWQNWPCRSALFDLVREQHEVLVAALKDHEKQATECDWNEPARAAIKRGIKAGVGEPQ